MSKWANSSDLNTFSILHSSKDTGTVVSVNDHYHSSNGAHVGFIHHHPLSTLTNHITATSATFHAPLSLFLFSLTISIASIFLCSIIALYFFRSYRLFGFGYLLGLPTGFVVLAASFVFEHLNLVYSYSYSGDSLEDLFLWIQLALKSEGFALIGLSYMLKNRVISTNAAISLLADTSKIFFSPNNWSYSHSTSRNKETIYVILPMILVSIPLMVPISALFVHPLLNDTVLDDMSIYITLFDILVLGYIIIKSLKSLVNAANIKLLYIPAAFALLWLEQYSLGIDYFNSTSNAFIVSLIVRLAGLGLFVYAIHYAMSDSRMSEIDIETGKET